MLWNQIRRIATILFIATSVATVAVGCSSTPTSRTAGETVDDATLTARVKTELAKEQGIGDALAINVDTYRGVVSLSGFVDSSGAIQKASECAWRVSGVKEVKNNLQVKPKS